MTPAFIDCPDPPNLMVGLNPLDLLDMGLEPTESDPAPFPKSMLRPEEVGVLLPAFKFLRLIGHGGMGAVYEAEQRDLKRRVAVKLLFSGLLDNPGQATRFRHESQLMARLDHDGIVRVLEAGETPEGHLYYVMEFVDGEDLAVRMKRGALDVDEAVTLLCEVAEGLQEAHALGIVHRDIKPGNILLPSQGRAKLGDFGLALMVEHAADGLRLTRSGTTLGTLEYAAPEQLDNPMAASPASDVYSLGVLTYELFTQELPRGNFTLPSVKNSAVDPAFDAVILRALQNDPERRFADASEFRQALLAASDRHSQQAARDKLLRKRMLRRTLWAVGFGIVALLTGGSAIVALKARDEARQAESETEELVNYLLTDLRKKLEPSGNLPAMDSVTEKAVAHFREKYEAGGQTPDLAMRLAEGLMLRADVIGVRGKAKEADEIYGEVIRLCENTVAKESPANVAHQLRLVSAWQDRTEHRMTIGRFAEAVEDARQMLRAVASLRSGDAAQQFEIDRKIAHARKAIANAEAYIGPFDDAEKEYLEARRLLSELAKQHPDNQLIADEAADLDASLGSLAEGRKDYPAMLRYFTGWHEFVQRRYGPENMMVSYSSFRMGVAMVKTSRPSEAVPYLNDAVRLAEKAVNKAPGHQGQLNHLGWCLRTLADAHEAMGNADEAKQLRAKDAEITAQLQGKKK